VRAQLDPATMARDAAGQKPSNMLSGSVIGLLEPGGRLCPG
jgi:hypothetical protein